MAHAPAARRSTDARDYQDIAQPIGAMTLIYPDGHVIPMHVHPRDQLLYGVRGVMRLLTERDAWAAPPDRAVYIPAGTPHSVHMHGDVDIRTLYIAPERGAAVKSVRVVAVSNLLRELVLALTEEPVDYTPESRAGRIARLIEDEIARAVDLSLGMPLPRDRRLQRVCAELLSDLADNRPLEAWADFAGASPRTLARLFERDLGMSFRAWRQRARFHGALQALGEGAPVAEVARRTGYRSPSAFAAAFRKAFGAPPTGFASRPAVSSDVSP